MAIFLQGEHRVIVQGITGSGGYFHTMQMIEYGTNIVGGVTAGRGGEWVHGKPVFDSVHSAVQMTGADVSVIFVPPEHAADAIFEAIDSGISLIVCVTEGIPVLDMMKVYNYLKQSRSRLIGPNCPGILIPDVINVGIIPGMVAQPGSVGVVSRSGALTYDVVNGLSRYGLGQSTIIGIGGDPIIGTSFIDVLERFENDPDTDRVVILGEIGGRAEVEAAEFIAKRMTKMVAAFVAGRSAPPDRRMGHAGAIIEGGTGTAVEKIEALRAAGVRVADNPEELPELLR
ncbi:MAG: succinate--CoA ligase subunit alpha [Chloroflexota bacterium]